MARQKIYNNFKTRTTDIGVLKQLRGFLVGIAFLLIGVFLNLESNEGVMGYMTGLGIPSLFWSVMFAVSGLVMIYVALNRLRWYTLWFTPYFAYCVATLYAAADNVVPVTPVLLYFLLAALFIIELVTDRLKSQREHYGW